MIGVARLAGVGRRPHLGGTTSLAPSSLTQTASRVAASVWLEFWVSLCSVPGGSTQL